MNQYNHVLHEFDIVIDEECEILILGSFPSVKSREHRFFYMNPQNRFWKVISSVFNDDFVSASIEEKRKLLLKHHIGLYDVVTECDIVGSQDTTIKNVSYLDIKSILSSTKIERIFLNGNKAYSLFCKAFPSYTSIATKLPSTSPANAKMKLEELIADWSRIIYGKEEN